MKHIKSVNEFYHRTIGFKYSNPTEKYSLILYYIGNLSVEQVKEVLEDNKITYEDIEVNPGQEDVKIDGGNVMVDGVAYFNLLVYTHKEIDKILNDIERGLYIESNVKVVDFTIRPFPKDVE